MAQTRGVLDGGIRRGRDVVKALALGANAVMIGRPYLWGLAAEGQAGVENLLDIMRLGIDSALLGLGLALMVAPLTATVLAAAPDEHAGIASGVNNALARAGSLLAVAALPVAVGLHGADYEDPAVFNDGYRMAMIACAVLLTLGGVVSWLTIRNKVLEEQEEAQPDPRSDPA